MNQDAAELKRSRIKAEIRREQCRTNQARYRNKQRNLQLQLETAVKHLRDELTLLKRQRQKILLAEKTDQSPWTIVTEVFRVLENSFKAPWNLEREEDMQNDTEAKRNLAFLHRTFTADAAVGEVRGIDNVIEQWRRISQYFGESQLQLQRVESVAPGAITATARLRFVATELTLRYMFPHLRDVEPQSKYDIQPSLRDKLLGHHVDCVISVDFLFESENGRVARVEPQIDMMPILAQILKNMSDVAEVWCSNEADTC
ncbi:bZIP transcription factor 1 [Phytophthora citrophthora]|uniref:BZIP transcription factor 1 n=1 Tax=Phytophthora citrophthora TaxID=4793 RepID=A0AAD9LEZ3_9STRA|nr:bZIP transcription factor 1 [Phytophthora citrophthora]